MALTVKAITDKFDQLKYDDLKKLTGKSNFNSTDTVSLTNVADYRGNYYKDLSIWTAEQEGSAFTKLLPEDKLKTVSQKVDIEDNKQGQNNFDGGQIPKDVSIFDYNKKNKMLGSLA